MVWWWFFFYFFFFTVIQKLSQWVHFIFQLYHFVIVAGYFGATWNFQNMTQIYSEGQKLSLGNFFSYFRLSFPNFPCRAGLKYITENFCCLPVFEKTQKLLQQFARVAIRPGLPYNRNMPMRGKSTLAYPPFVQCYDSDTIRGCCCCFLLVLSSVNCYNSLRPPSPPPPPHTHK